MIGPSSPNHNPSHPVEGSTYGDVSVQIESSSLNLDSTDHFSRLPPEIVVYLACFLHYNDVLSVRSISHHFHHSIPASDLPKHHQATAPLVHAQETAAREALNIKKIHMCFWAAMVDVVLYASRAHTKNRINFLATSATNGCFRRGSRMV